MPALVGGAALLGFWLGARRVVHRCSECLYVVPPSVETCTKCGGRLVGEIARREDRLDHEEDREP